jgi:Holliday junction DNA helicase RuvA
MIAYLEGVLAESVPPNIVIDVHGVGYEVILPLNAFDRLPSVGKTARVLTHFQVREDAQQLFGFLRREERDLFRLLLRVSGIGPRVAIGIVGAVTPRSFQAAVVAADARALARLPGVGKKTAERLIVELRDALGIAAVAPGTGQPPLGTEADRNALDAAMALIALGYKPADAHRAVGQAVKTEKADADVDHLVRAALKNVGAVPS